MTIKETKMTIYSAVGEQYDIPQYTLIPDQDKILVNKITGLVIKTFIVVGSKNEINNYIEKKK